MSTRNAQISARARARYTSPDYAFPARRAPLFNEADAFLQQAASVTGKTYAPGQEALAREDLAVWIAAARDAIR